MGGGHDDRCQVLGPERLRGKSGDESRVDPAREAEHGLFEAVLAGVVAEREDERLVDLGCRRQRFTGLVDGDLRTLPRRAQGRNGSQRAGVTPSRVPTPEREVDDHQVLGELSAAGECLAVGGDDDAVAVEDELVLAADEVAEGDRDAVLDRAAGDDLPLPRHPLAAVVGRGGAVDDQVRARGRFVGGR